MSADKELLANALEHLSHVWAIMKAEEMTSQYDADSWPPVVSSQPGRLDYHVAAVIEYVKKAHDGA